MSQTVFKSPYPILEACMNRGSTLPLALAVHRAGAYPSLCSWSYDRNWDLMQQDVRSFIKITGSNRIHVSFELEEMTDPSQMIDIVVRNQLDTVELIYGLKNSTMDELRERIRTLVRPLHQAGVKLFRRTNLVIDQTAMERQFLSGFMIKGRESAGVRGTYTVRELMQLQREATPDALLIPYGGVGRAEQVREYLDQGAEIVGVGTLLAFSADSPVKPEAKQWVIDHSSGDLKTYSYEFPKQEQHIGARDIQRNALEFSPYTGPDPWNGDENRTAGLITGLYDRQRSDGHLMVGHSIDHVNSLRTVREIVEDLCSTVASSRV
jgi:NAD(P)H-dependent flavin oxidoreductase YrpB (nitropropane dioxygenase family)